MLEGLDPANGNPVLPFIDALTCKERAAQN